MSNVPTTQKEWRVQGQNGPDSLKFNEQALVPKLGDKDVLVKFHAASLNYRDIIIPRGLYPFPVKENIVPASDGAGEVVAIGPHVTRFKPGDKVVTLFNQGHIAGSLDTETLATGVGGFIDGSLRQYGAFNQEGLVHVPKNLNWLEASTLSCAAVTAWNGLYGLEGRSLKPGDWVITQGTGGVSIFALQVSTAHQEMTALVPKTYVNRSTRCFHSNRWLVVLRKVRQVFRAKVIATTSSKAKADKLKQLGADEVINYKETPNWGEKAKELTDGRGVDFVIEVGGANTLAQSIKSVCINGVISVIGFLGGPSEDQPNLFGPWIIRGLVVGSRQQFEDMNRAIEAKDIHPIVDKQLFSLDQTKDAYQYLWDQKHFGKVVIKID
ncbi:hypothetical protein AARAC_009328 [Aspergillus arachidicola]|uniref:Enoyl reductase (ER) domain-containing protein n=1 Tax=Aspergillus arachidicola TaxID=656916 RepID=A0A2G7FSE1_9EURO|nr:hypothetical protein AARAC_009328 [Aspergillus arachidicola]